MRLLFLLLLMLLLLLLMLEKDRLLSIRFLLESDHFGALAGQGLIFIDFQLNSY